MGLVMRSKLKVFYERFKYIFNILKYVLIIGGFIASYFILKRFMKLKDLNDEVQKYLDEMKKKNDEIKKKIEDINKDYMTELDNKKKRDAEADDLFFKKDKK